MKLYLELLANYKKQKKNVGNLISQIRLIIHQNNIQIDSEGKPLEELVDNFILSYMKLIDKLEKEEESRVIAECLVEEIIRKVARMDIQKPEKILRASAILVGFLVFAHIFYILYIYFDLARFRGQTGPKGIPGLRGKNGNPGECNSSCGKDLCFKKCIDKINKTLREKGVEEKFDNNFLTGKINDQFKVINMKMQLTFQ